MLVLILASTSIFTILILNPLFSCADLVYSPLAHSASTHGYVGPNGEIELTVSYRGVEFTIKLNISGADAYAAFALMLIGDYDTVTHKWASVGLGHGMDLKDWRGFGLWESYSFSVLESSEIPNEPDSYYSTTGVVFTAQGHLDYSVTHCTWWFYCVTGKDTLPASVSVVIPYDSWEYPPA